ncbi:uncharacterized protein LOC111715147 [Eurytemora carolleeae]|uniref:uncharacterized protein LOC111715147 n=1 Tax=Eurytemora carolleeae TaxID=1294199 RepID=UPI000C759082|nr:uncharacterized protein LOC111715147 [Eurytemora carolleeae]|eukprot:XP_023346183.1 uncharacterized protein LOC111715147 [Eurytemora affinis]
MRTLYRTWLVVLPLSALLLFVSARIEADDRESFFLRDYVDPFEEVRMKMESVTEENCGIKHVGDLYLHKDTVSHIPDIKEININPVFPNRTALLHLHNMALSRAFFFSFALQTRFNRPGVNDTHDPGLMYYYLSTVADVAANPKLNASAIYFSPNMAYSPSYKGFFNLTFPLYAPRTYR